MVVSKRGLHMKKIKTIRALSGHTIAIFKVEPDSIHIDGKHPANIDEGYTHFYIAKNFDAEGVTFFYLAKGHKGAPNQIHVWYRNKNMWSSFGNNFE
jgi:hypothetical protein